MVLAEKTDFQIDDADFKLVCDVVYKHCGISLGTDKKSLVQARITKQMRINGHNSAKDYLAQVFSSRSGTAFSEFIDAISTNLTSFFRENEHFKYLSNTALPSMLKQKRQAGDGRLLTWCAACSSGEEPYSLAITLLEAIDRLPPDSLRWDVRILATDISTRMLKVARAGVYEESRLSTVPPHCRSKYFTSDTEDPRGRPLFTVTPEARAMVHPRHLNLMDQWPFRGPFDFIFCRNVMIYFDKKTQQELVNRFWSCLRPGGLLFTGHSESLMGIAHRFTNLRPSIYRKTE